MIRWFSIPPRKNPECPDEEVSVFELKDHPDFNFRPGISVVRVGGFEVVGEGGVGRGGREVCWGRFWRGWCVGEGFGGGGVLGKVLEGVVCWGRFWRGWCVGEGFGEGGVLGKIFVCILVCSGGGEVIIVCLVVCSSGGDGGGSCGRVVICYVKVGIVGCGGEIVGLDVWCALARLCCGRGGDGGVGGRKHR